MNGTKSSLPPSEGFSRSRKNPSVFSNLSINVSISLNQASSFIVLLEIFFLQSKEDSARHTYSFVLYM